MTATITIAVGLAGGVGAVARFALDGRFTGRPAGAFPFGTLVVNVLGAFVLGAFVGAGTQGSTYLILGTGLIGGFTTFSTWAFESHRLGEDGELKLGVLNLTLSLALGLGAVWAGRHVGSWL